MVGIGSSSHNVQLLITSAETSNNNHAKTVFGGILSNDAARAS